MRFNKYYTVSCISIILLLLLYSINSINNDTTHRYIAAALDSELIRSSTKYIFDTNNDTVSNNDIAADTTIPTPSHNIALFFMTDIVDMHLYMYTVHIAECNLYDIYIIADNNTIDYTYISGYVPNLTILQYDTDTVYDYGYHGLHNGLESIGTVAWDKALYANTVDERYAYKYDYVIWIEQDIFIPTVHTLYSMTRDIVTYRDTSNHSCDIATSHKASMKDWWWGDKYRKHGIWKYIKPFAWHSMIPIIGFSRQYLQLIHQFHTTVYPITDVLNELILTSVSSYYNLTICHPVQLSPYIEYRHTNLSNPYNFNISWEYDDIIYREIDKIYHPVKDPVMQSYMRNDMLVLIQGNDDCPIVN